MENCWQLLKGDLRKFPHWDDTTTKGLIYEGWTMDSQEFINEKVELGHEKITGYQGCRVEYFWLPAAIMYRVVAFM